MNLDNIRVVLVNTSHPGNIGAAARAMKNMGLTSLYLVAPRDFPSGVAKGRAASAKDLLENAVVTDTLAAAIADCSLVIGTSARSRRIPWPMVNPEECALKLTTEMQNSQVALVFGREDRGMSNEELQLCHYHVQIPAHEDYSSLNLGSAVMVLGYEVRKALLRLTTVDPTTTTAITTTTTTTAASSEAGSGEANWDLELATAQDLTSYLDHLENLMTRLKFHDPDNPRHLLPRLRRLYSRIRLDKMEINILHGIIAATEQALDNARNDSSCSSNNSSSNNSLSNNSPNCPANSKESEVSGK